jgi:uncharacterized RDD family membrane protein YckC
LQQQGLLAALNFAMFILLHGFLLYHQGQTIGKRMLRIRMVDLRGEVPALGRMLVTRYGIFWLISQIPGIGLSVKIADAAMIFRKDRRCLHDLTAGTRVVEVDG